MLKIVRTEEERALRNIVGEYRKEISFLRRENKRLKFEIGDWKSQVVILESENKTLNKRLEKINNDNVKENARKNGKGIKFTNFKLKRKAETDE